MINGEDTRLLNKNCKQYILEELAVLEGCVAQGLGFSNSKSPHSQQKQNAFIVYPGNEENAFIQAKQQLKHFDTPKNPFLLDVQWLKISVHEELDNHNNHCWSRFVTPAKILFDTKQKNLLFLISIGKKYHEGNYLQATVNLFANAIRGCVDLIKQEKNIKQLNKEKHIDNAKGEWQITVVAADTLQAYNDPLYDSQRDEVIKKQYELGQQWIKLATPIFTQLKDISEDLVPVNIRFINWNDCLKLATTDFSYYKYYSHLIETYAQPNSSTEAKLFYDAVRLKGFEFLDRVIKTKQDPVATKKTDSKQLIGLSDSDQAKKPQFILEQCRIVKNYIYNLNHHYMGPTIEPGMLASGISVPFHIPQLISTKCISRDHLLFQLNQLLATPPGQDITSLINVVICFGAGGVGKSHLIATYANNPKHHYTLRIWLNCRSESDLMISFKQLGQSLMIVDDHMKYEEIKQTVIQWLEQNPGWLIIMDDIYDFDASLEFLPKINAGHVILTSRERPHKFNNTLEIGVMIEKESVNLFSVISERKENENNIKELVKKLSYLPLAIELAAAHLKKNPTVTIQEYDKEYDKDCLNSMGNKELIGIAGGIAYKPIAVTYNLSIGRIREKYKLRGKNNKFSEIIEQLLTVCSYLAPDNIPLILLEKWFQIYWVDKVNAKKEYFEKIVILLKDHLIIQYDSHNNLLSIHSVMQDVIRAKHYKSLGFNFETLNNDSINLMKGWLDTISSVIDQDIINYYDGFSTQQAAIEAKKNFLSHLAKVHNFYPQCTKLSTHAVRIQITAGYISATLNDHDKAICILEPLLSIYLDDDSYKSLLHSCLATAYELKNNINMAKNILLNYVNTISDHSEDNALLLKIKLAIYYSILRETNNAVTLLNEILPKLINRYGEDSEYYCSAISALAVSYFYMDRFAEAKRLGESILGTCRTKRYITFLEVTLVLVHTYIALGQPQRAKALYEEAINTQNLDGDKDNIKKFKTILRMIFVAIRDNDHDLKKNNIDEFIQDAKSCFGDTCKIVEMSTVFTNLSKSRTVENEIAALKFASTMNNTPGQRKLTQSFIQNIRLLNSIEPQHVLERKLRSAAASCVPEALRLYLSIVKNINAQGENSKMSALHWAVIKGSKECVSILLAAGANMHLQDISKQSAFDYALKKSTDNDEHAAILELLREQILETALDEFIEKERLENTTTQKTSFLPN